MHKEPQHLPPYSTPTRHRLCASEALSDLAFAREQREPGLDTPGSSHAQYCTPIPGIHRVCFIWGPTDPWCSNHFVPATPCRVGSLRTFSLFLLPSTVCLGKVEVCQPGREVGNRRLCNFCSEGRTKPASWWCPQ